MVCAGGGGTRCGAPLSGEARTERRVLSQCDEMGGINN